MGSPLTELIYTWNPNCQGTMALLHGVRSMLIAAGRPHLAEKVFNEGLLPAREMERLQKKLAGYVRMQAVPSGPALSRPWLRFCDAAAQATGLRQLDGPRPHGAPRALQLDEGGWRCCWEDPKTPDTGLTPYKSGPSRVLPWLLLHRLHAEKHRERLAAALAASFGVGLAPQDAVERLSTSKFNKEFRLFRITFSPLHWEVQHERNCG